MCCYLNVQFQGQRVNTVAVWLCVTEAESVYCAVRTGLLYRKQRSFVFKGFISLHTTDFFNRIIIRIKMGARPKDSCREFFKTLHLYPLGSLYVLFMIRKKALFKISS